MRYHFANSQLLAERFAGLTKSLVAARKPRP